MTLRAGIKLSGNKGICPKCGKEVFVLRLTKTLRKKRYTNNKKIIFAEMSNGKAV